MNPQRLQWTRDVKLKQEDEAMLELIQELGTKQWTQLADRLKHTYDITGRYCLLRTAKMCRYRWINHLRDSRNTTEWTEEEIALVFEAQKKLGTKWAQIAKLLHGRTEGNIKNLFYSTVRKNWRRLNRNNRQKAAVNYTELLKDPRYAEELRDYQTPGICKKYNRCTRAQPRTYSERSTQIESIKGQVSSIHDSTHSTANLLEQNGSLAFPKDNPNFIFALLDNPFLSSEQSSLLKLAAGLNSPSK